ncbi:MAG: hypothetical protein NT120_01900 [Candidatus Aenigmarchaeota archaeon]|nr:hypothetical protein [Candidatus Aenigmarchaeota archaeon]
MPGLQLLKTKPTDSLNTSQQIAQYVMEHDKYPSSGDDGLDATRYRVLREWNRKKLDVSFWDFRDKGVEKPHSKSILIVLYASASGNFDMSLEYGLTGEPRGLLSAKSLDFILSMTAGERKELTMKDYQRYLSHVYRLLRVSEGRVVANDRQ